MATTVLAYGDKPASMTDEAYATALMTFMMEHVDIWLRRLAAYDGWTADQILALDPAASALRAEPVAD